MRGGIGARVARLEVARPQKPGMSMSDLLRAAMVQNLAGDRIRLAMPGWLAELERVNPDDARRIRERQTGQYYDITVAEIDAAHAELLAAGWVPERPEPVEVWDARIEEALGLRGAR